jgi:hypothetical protein
MEESYYVAEKSIVTLVESEKCESRRQWSMFKIKLDYDTKHLKIVKNNATIIHEDYILFTYCCK